MKSIIFICKGERKCQCERETTVYPEYDVRGGSSYLSRFLLMGPLNGSSYLQRDVIPDIIIFFNATTDHSYNFSHLFATDAFQNIVYSVGYIDNQLSDAADMYGILEVSHRNFISFHSKHGHFNPYMCPLFNLSSERISHLFVCIIYLRGII